MEIYLVSACNYDHELIIGYFTNEQKAREYCKLHNSDNNTEIIANEVLDIMKSDKKNSFGNINLILPVDIEKVEEVNTIEESQILNVIKECHNA